MFKASEKAAVTGPVVRQESTEEGIIGELRTCLRGSVGATPTEAQQTGYRETLRRGPADNQAFSILVNTDYLSGRYGGRISRIRVSPSQACRRYRQEHGAVRVGPAHAVVIVILGIE